MTRRTSALVALGRLPLVARMWLSLARLQVRYRWPIFLGAALGIQTLLAFISPVSALVSAIASAAGLLLFVRDWRANARERRDLVVEYSASDFSAIYPSPTYLGAELIKIRDHLLQMDCKVNELLAVNPLDAQLAQAPYQLPVQMRNLVPSVVAHHVRRGHLVFNGRVLRLESDITRAAFTDHRPIVLRPTYYFDTLASDYLATHEVSSLEHRRVLFRGRDLLVSRSGLIRDLASSWSANGIGVSTVAVTSDGAVLLPHQTTSNVSEGDRRAPSGSGSAEPHDYPDDAHSASLQEVVVCAMERELREECNIPASAGMHTQLLGFARWLDHGGKPEFYGMSFLESTEREVVDFGHSTRERRLVGNIHLWRPDWYVLSNSAGDFEKLQKLLGPTASVPLLMCVNLMAELMTREPTRMGHWSQTSPPPG